MGLLNRIFGGGNLKPPRDETETILGRHLDRDFRVYPMADSQQTMPQVEAISRRHGIRYPVEYVAHLCGRFPGIYVEVKEEVWPRPKLYDVGPFWTFLYGLHTYTPTVDSDPWMRLDDSAKSFQSETGLCAAPILKIFNDADLFCVDAHGHIVQFIHETNELKPTNLTFWQLFEREVRELRTRKDQKTQE